MEKLMSELRKSSSFGMLLLLAVALPATGSNSLYLRSEQLIPMPLTDSAGIYGKPDSYFSTWLPW